MKTSLFLYYLLDKICSLLFKRVQNIKKGRGKHFDKHPNLLLKNTLNIRLGYKMSDFDKHSGSFLKIGSNIKELRAKKFYTLSN
jgi:hypothetical protein